MMLHDQSCASTSHVPLCVARRGRVQAAACWLVISLCTATSASQSLPPEGTAPAASGSAAPQVSAAARAEALFNEGLALFDAKSYAAACAKFEESQKLDPAPGTLFRLATCEEEQGRFATAAQRWEEGASLLPKGDSRRASAEKNATETEGKAGRLVLRASPQAPPGLAVALDDRMLGAGELGAAILVDPGSHDLVITAPGHEPRTLTVTAASGETREVALMPGPALPAPKPTSAPIRTTHCPASPAVGRARRAAPSAS
jgi:hypothetical protein